MFFNQVLNMFNPRDNIIIVGDFNINLYNPLSLRYIDDFIHDMQGSNYFALLTLPSMINENNSISKYSLIDHIRSKFQKGKDHISGAIDYLISDHLPNFCVF